MKKNPAKGVLRLGAANVYVGNPNPARAAAIARATNFHSWGWSEGSRLPKHIDKRPRFVDLVARGMKAPRQGDVNDCVMQTSRALNIVHFSMTKACEEVPRSKVGHQRTFSMMAYKADFVRKGLVVCHIAVHPNWIVGLNKGPVVNRYVDSLAVLDSMIKFAKAQGWAVVVAGDLNTIKGQAKPYRTIYDVFAKHGLTVRTTRIDGVAWDKSKIRLVGWHEIPKGQTGSDHPWIVAEFRAAKVKATALRTLFGQPGSIDDDVVEETTIDVVADLGMAKVAA